MAAQYITNAHARRLTSANISCYFINKQPMPCDAQLAGKIYLCGIVQAEGNIWGLQNVRVMSWGNPVRNVQMKRLDPHARLQVFTFSSYDLGHPGLQTDSI